MHHHRSAGLAAVAILTAAGQMAMAQTTTAPSTEPAATPAATGQTVALKQSDSDFRSSKLVGTTVYNAADENIGEIEDLIIDAKGSVANVVIGVGGFLGMGEKNVAVPFTSLKTSRDNSGRVRVVVDGTKDSLKAMPAYTYVKS